MMALDTNVLIRFLVKDDEKQARCVYKIFRKAEQQQETLFVPLLVVLETIAVLQSVYEIADEEILSTLNALLLMPVLMFEASSVIQRFVASAREVKMDLSDLLIAHSAKLSSCKRVYTFDKKAAKYKYFTFLSE